jgi:hypothetical protein
MTDRGPQAAAVAILFLVLTWLSVALRVYVRGIMTNAFGVDDSLAVLALVCRSIETTMNGISECSIVSIHILLRVRS